MADQVVNSDESLQRLIGSLRTDYSTHRWLKVTWQCGKKRSLDQNDISHVWYGQLARELPENDALGWKCLCKWNFGVPILRAEDEGFRAFYNAALRHLSYEERIEAMKWVPVTSLMTKAQLTKYLETMRETIHKRRGVQLEFPEQERAA